MPTIAVLWISVFLLIVAVAGVSSPLESNDW